MCRPVGQEEGRGRRSLAKQFGDLWAMAQRRTVWMPMLFVAFYNTMQVGEGRRGSSSRRRSMMGVKPTHRAD